MRRSRSRPRLQAAGGLQESHRRTPEEMAAARAEMLKNIAPIGTGVLTIAVLLALILTTAAGVAPGERTRELRIGAMGVGLMLLADILFISPLTSPGHDGSDPGAAVSDRALRLPLCGGADGAE